MQAHFTCKLVQLHIVDQRDALLQQPCFKAFHRVRISPPHECFSRVVWESKIGAVSFCNQWGVVALAAGYDYKQHETSEPRDGMTESQFLQQITPPVGAWQLKERSSPGVVPSKQGV